MASGHIKEGFAVTADEAAFSCIMREDHVEADYDASFAIRAFTFTTVIH